MSHEEDGIWETVDRFTYVKGVYTLKYRTNLRKFEKDSFDPKEFEVQEYLDGELEITETRKDEEGRFSDSLNAIPFNVKIPNPVKCKDSSTKEVDEENFYHIKFHELRIAPNPEVKYVMQDEDGTYSTLICQFYGVIRDEVPEWRPTPKQEPIHEVANPVNATYDGTYYTEPLVNMPPPIKTASPTPLMNNSGCFDGCGTIILWALIIGVLLFITLQFGPVPALIIGGVLLVGYILNRFNLLERVLTYIGMVIYIGYFLVIFFIVGSFIYHLINGTNTTKYKTKSNTYHYHSDDKSEKDYRNSTHDSNSDNKNNGNDNNSNQPLNEKDYLITHLRKWTSLNGKTYLDTVKVWNSRFQRAKNTRNSLSIPFDDAALPKVYTRLSSSTGDGLDSVYSMLNRIAIRDSLNRREFADLIVSFVQDIEYKMILESACDEGLYNDEYIKSYLQQNGPCAGYAKYGLYSPIEFMATMDGDCDTRTLLLYTMLKNYNYDVIILGSYYYGHSILAVNLPGKGLYKEYHGKRYYVWETTYPNFQMGVIPPDIANMNYWEVFLN